jgi:cell wall-associated NlpC family hydrolase
VLIVCTLGATLAVSASAADKLAYGAATVDATLLNIRSGPSTDTDILFTIGDKTIVVILEKTNSEWFYINFEGKIGYAKSEFFTEILKAENFSATGEVTGTDVRMRKKPDTSSNVLTTFNTGDTLAVIGINNGWFKVKDGGKTGYIRSDFLSVISGYNPTKATKGGSPAPSKTGNELVDYALGYVGYEYQYGGMSPKTGFDCSGFASYVFKNFGVTLTRNSAGQYKNDGTKVSKDELAPGDLLFFGSGKSVGHVGIYMGDNEFVHASGERVGVVVSRLDSTYYINHYIGAKRISF